MQPTNPQRISWQLAAQLTDGGHPNVYEAVAAEDTRAYALGTFMDPARYLRSEGFARDEAGNNRFLVCLDSGVAGRSVDF
jgi:hypothetical protein